MNGLLDTTLGSIAMASHLLTSKLNSSLGQGIGLSLGAILLLGNGSAIAQMSPELPFSVSQNDSGRPDVIIDTEPNSGTVPGLPGTDADDDPRFTCEYFNGEYAVMYNPENQPGEAYPWAIPSAMGGGWTPQNRCVAISQRLESYRPDGLLELQTGIENNYDVVCATTQKDPRCRIVFTVPPGQDPILTRDRVFENLTVADSGQITEGVNTYVEGSSGGDIFSQLSQILTGNPSILGNIDRANPADAINLRPFLSPADGGTGERLTEGRLQRSSNPRFNPDRF
jgi:Circadian oscillating protein COP23